MGFLNRVIELLGGHADRRIPEQLELLGAPADTVAEARAMPEVEQEELLLRFVEGKHAVVLDWRAGVEDLYGELEPILTADERKLMPPIEEMPDEAPPAIARLHRAFSGSERVLVRTESFGDFTILFLVPRDRERAFVKCIGAWRIPDE